MSTRMTVWIFLLSAAILQAEDAAPQNLLHNPGFETRDLKNDKMPADWGPFAEKGETTAYMLVTDTPKDGNFALKMAFDNNASTFYGVLQRLPARAGKQVTWTVFLRNVSMRDESYVQISIEWIGEDKKEISRSWGPAAKAVDVTTDDWKKFEVVAVAPEGAVEMNTVVTMFPAGSPDGALLLDDASASSKDAPKKPAP